MSNRPTESYWIAEDKTARLFFEEDSKFPDGVYCATGGITFPVLVESEIMGAAVVIGQYVDTDDIYVLDDMRFVTVDPVVSANGRIEFKGLASWLNRAMSAYYLQRLYYKQDYESRRRCMAKIRKSDMLKTAPRFLNIDWVNEEFGNMIPVHETVAFGKLKYLAQSSVKAEMEQYNAEQDRFYPSLHALNCALHGMERRPYRKKGLDF